MQMTVMLLPFVFYKLLKTKEVAVYELIALLSMLAGAVFGIEVLFVGEVFYSVLLPSVLSGISAYLVFSFPRCIE